MVFSDSDPFSLNLAVALWHLFLRLFFSYGGKKWKLERRWLNYFCTSWLSCLGLLKVGSNASFPKTLDTCWSNWFFTFYVVSGNFQFKFSNLLEFSMNLAKNEYGSYTSSTSCCSTSMSQLWFRDISPVLRKLLTFWFLKILLFSLCLWNLHRLFRMETCISWFVGIYIYVHTHISAVLR